MECINPTLARDYPPLKLYLDDLEVIEKILNSARSVKFISNDYQSNTLADLTEMYKGTRLRKFNICVLEPDLKIFLEPSRSRLYCAVSDTYSTGVFHKLDTILKKSARPRFLYSSRTLGLLSLAFLILAITLPSPTDIKLYMLSLQYIPTLLCAALVIWWVWVIYVQWAYHSLIIMSRRSRINFFVRNRDELLVALIGAIFSVLIGLLASPNP